MSEPRGSSRVFARSGAGPAGLVRGTSKARRPAGRDLHLVLGDLLPVCGGLAVHRCVYRALFGLPLLTLVALAERRRSGPLPARTVRLAAIAGVFFAGDLLFWHHAIEAVGAGLATVLGNLQVIIVGFIAWLVLGERPSRGTVIALPIVLVGVVCISGVVGSDAFGADPALGVVLGILTASVMPGTC